MDTYRVLPWLVALALFVFLIPSVTRAANLLTNPGFESADSEGSPPPGWVTFAGQMGEHMWVEPGGSLREGQVLVINSGGVRNAGLRSEPIPAAPGEVYQASAQVYAQPGNRPALYLDFWDANKRRITSQSVSASQANEWQTLSVSHEAPEGTEWVSIILYSNANAAPDRALWDNAVLELDRSYVVRFEPDHADHLYEVGETATFTVTVLQGGRPVERAGAQWRFTRENGEVVSSGISTLTDGQGQITAQLTEPGFLRAHVTVVGAGGSATGSASVGFSPHLIQISRPAPDDFDEFWETKKAELAAIPPVAQLTPVASGVVGVEAFDVRVDSLGVSVSGYLARPTNAEPGTLPAIVMLHGAGVSSARMTAVTGWASDGALALDINAHGIPNGHPGSYYTQLAANELLDYRTWGRESRDEFYFLGMFLRVIRAIDFITSQPEWDGKTLVLYGTSQGGAQALAGAGLDERVTFFAAGVPAMADFGGMVKDRPMRWDLRTMNPAQAERIRETLQYFDTAQFAARTKADGFFTAAFLDNTVFASTVYAAHNAVSGSVGIFNDPLVGHTNTPEALQAMRSAVLDHMASMKER